ncbi:MAG: hypothetical protein RI910_2081 [Verrucomicrobiota bacterium]
MANRWRIFEAASRASKPEGNAQKSIGANGGCACCCAAATRNKVDSPNGRATYCAAIGKPLPSRPAGTAIASLWITGTSQRLDAERIAKLTHVVTKAAKMASEALHPKSALR